MMATAKVPDGFYVILFSNASQKLYTDNTIAAFTNRLAIPVQLGSTESWEVGICEFSCPPPVTGTMKVPASVVSETTGLIYCNLSKSQLVGGNIARCLRTFLYRSTYCHHLFDNVYYMPVETGAFQNIRIEILTAEGRRVKFEDSKSPSKVVLHFRRRRVSSNWL